MIMDPHIDLLPIHIAAAKNDVQELARLIQQGETVIDHETNESPLHAAARSGSNDALIWLLENHIASPLEKASNGNTAAHYAAVYGHLEALKLLISHDPSISDQVSTETDENGLSILSLATLQGDEEMVVWILENFPRVAEVPNASGNLAVHFAAAQGYLQILKLLVKKCGRDIAEKQDSHLTKPVYFASQEGKLDVLDYLINELGVDPVARDKSGMSCVHAATQGGQPNAIKWLISKLGPKYILDKTIDGATPLHMAAALGQSEILQFFLNTLEEKTDIDVLDHIHATPAHDAAEYGQKEAMILLLKHGASVNIKDTENKTPYELAMEQNHTEVANMIADYRENGPTILAKYEKRKYSQPSRDLPSSEQSQPRTSHQEAAEISSVIQQTAQVMEHRKEQHQNRRNSRMNEDRREEKMDTWEDEPKRKSSGSRQHRRSYPSDEEDEEIEHTLGPQGDLYARPRRRKHHKSNYHQNSDLEDFMSETMSHHSYSSTKAHTSRVDALPLGESPYPLVSHGASLETASNYSRPSRVKHYQDSDSEISSFSSSRYPQDGRHNIPGFYPGYDPRFPPPIPPGHTKAHSVTGASRHYSQADYHRGYPPPPPHMPYPGPYGYHPVYYGYPPYPPYAPGYHPKTTEERMHLAALQHGRLLPLPPAHYQHPGMYMHGRRSALAMKQSRRQPGPPKQHTDQDIGYGPALEGAQGPEVPINSQQEEEDFHPPAPPVTLKDGSIEQGNEHMVAFDSNFIMTKKTENADVRQVAGTTLNPAKAGPKPYDGRWDDYITSDSEEEEDVEEQFSVAFAAEAVAILAIGCVAGLKGLQKVRKGKPSAISDIHKAERSHFSSAWDAEPEHRRKGSRKDAISGLDDPTLKGMSPEEFASREEWGSSNWEKSQKKSSSKPKSSSAEALENPQSELLTAELQKQSFSSVSKHLGQQILTDSLGARDSSMLNIASSSVVSSRMSLNQSSDEDDDDDFGDAISIVHGITPSKTPGKKEKPTKASQGEQHPEERKNNEKTKREKEKKQKKDKKEKKDKKGKEGKPQKGNSDQKKEVKLAKIADPPKTKEIPATSNTNPQGKATKIPPPTRATKAPEVSPTTRANLTPRTPPATRATKPSKILPTTMDNTTAKAPTTRRVTDPVKTPPAMSTESTKPTRAPKKPEKPSVSTSPRKMVIQPSPPVPHKEQEIRLKAAETTSNSVAMASKHTRRERLAQASVEKQTNMPSATAPTEEHKVTVTVPVHGKNSQTGPREVKNQFFDDESDEEPEVQEKNANLSEAEQIEESMRNMANDLTSFLEDSVQTNPTTSTKYTDTTHGQFNKTSAPLLSGTSTQHKIASPEHSRTEHAVKVDLIEMDETSRDIFGEDGLAELNAALMELSTIQSGLGFKTPEPAKPKSATSRGEINTKLTTSKPEEVSRVDSSSVSSGSGEVSYEFSAKGKGHMKSLEEPEDESQVKPEQETQEVVLSFQGEGIASTSANTVSWQQPMQGLPRSSSFEQNLLTTLKSLNETINEMKANPSATQTQIDHQQQIQQQLIQNMLTYSQNDPQLMSKLLALLQDKDTEHESSSSHQLETLEHKLMDAQQKQLYETQEHFRTQAEFQQAIQRKLEEQTEKQMKGIQSNFDKYTQLLEQQLAEQRRKWEEELKRRDEEDKLRRENEKIDKEKKRRKSKDRKQKKKHRKHYFESESSATDSEDEMVQPSLKTTGMKPAVKTMEAKIYTQELLDPAVVLEESFPETPAAKEKQGLLKRRKTEFDLSRTTDALRRFEGEEDEEDDVEMQFQHARPVTLKRADIIQMQEDSNDYTPHRTHGTSEITHKQREDRRTQVEDEFHILRPKPPTFIDSKEPVQEFDESRLKYGHQHVEPNQHKKNVPSDDPTTAGAGGELAAALRIRQKQLKV